MLFCPFNRSCETRYGSYKIDAVRNNKRESSKTKYLFLNLINRVYKEMWEAYQFQNQYFKTSMAELGVVERFYIWDLLQGQIEVYHKRWIIVLFNKLFFIYNEIDKLKIIKSISSL